MVIDTSVLIAIAWDEPEPRRDRAGPDAPYVGQLETRLL
jgi:hypothetical protein